MPWDVNNPPRPAKNWSPAAKALCVRVANGVMKGGGTDQEAIYACIRAVKNKYPSSIKAPRSSWRKASEFEQACAFFDDKSIDELKVIFAPLLPDLIEFAPWKSATKTGLPDSAYAIVYTKPDGTKIRALPHHDKSGGLDLPHLRNALARWNQVKGVPDAIKSRGLTHLRAHAKGALKSGKSGQPDRKAATDFTDGFYSISDIVLKEENGRYTSSLQVLPEGKFTHPWYGDLDFTAPILAKMKRHFDAKVLGTDVMVDEGHDKGKALGWYKGLHTGSRSVDGKEYAGLFADIEWTTLGRQYLEQKLYKYFSAEVGNWTGPDGKKVENLLLGGALTNRPFFKQMAAVQFSEGTADNRFVIGLFGDAQWSFETPGVAQGNSTTFNANFSEFVSLEEEDDSEDPEEDEDEEEGQEDEDQMDELIAAINAAHKKDFSTTEEVLAFMGELNKAASSERLVTTFAALGLEFKEGEDPVAVIAKAFKAAKDQNTDLSNRVSSIEGRFQDSEFERAFDEQLRAGKVVPAQKEHMHRLFKADAKLFNDLMGTTQPVIQLGELGAGISEEPGSATDSKFREGTEDTTKEAQRYVQLVGGRTGGKKEK